MDIEATLLISLVLLLLLIPVTFFLKNKFDNNVNKNQPPSPPTLPILGNLHQLGPLPHQSLWRLAKKHGPVMSLRLGSVPTVVVSSADAAKTVMKTHDLDSCSRPSLEGDRMLTYGYQDLGMAPYGKHWREVRKICVLEIFSVRRIHSFWSAREEELGRLIDSVSAHASSATPFDLTDAAMSYTGGIIFRIVFGMSFQDSYLSGNKFFEVIEEVSEVIGNLSAADYFPYVGWIVDWLTGLKKRREDIFRKADDLFQGVIDAHRSPSRIKPESDDLIDVFLKLINDQTGFGATLSEISIKAVLTDIFLGAIDTGAITLVCAMGELAKKPELMKKAQHELRTCFGNKGRAIINEADIDQLQYLKMIVKETLRLHPPLPLILPRETISHFKIGGYDILPKTLLQVNVWAIGRDPECWKNPEEFIPERFSDSPIDYKGQHFELLPFGSGRRMCPAVYMGASTVELGLANMLYRFDWKLPNGMKVEDLDMDKSIGQSVTTFKRTALKLVPVKYN